MEESFLRAATEVMLLTTSNLEAFHRGEPMPCKAGLSNKPVVGGDGWPRWSTGEGVAVVHDVLTARLYTAEEIATGAY